MTQQHHYQYEVKEIAMQVNCIDHMFRFHFEKSADEIKAKAVAKIKTLKEKVIERQGRVKRTREEYKVTDDVWSNILMQMRQANNKNANSYSVSNVRTTSNGTVSEEVTIPAGVVNQILTEQDFIAGENSQIDKLDIIARNLKDLKVDGEVKGHSLSYDEIVYLGF